MLILATLVAISTHLQTQELTVFAAASLKESFTSIATAFEAKQPGTHVHLSFAGSQQLATQILQGAPCDVFASADDANLAKVATDPTSRRVFALNKLVVVTPASRPALKSFRELPSKSSLVLGAQQVPCGAYSREALLIASKEYGQAWMDSVERRIVSLEPDVRTVLTKVELGEADAGIVYTTDALSAGGRVHAFALPAKYQPFIRYPVAIVKSSSNAHLARQLIHSILSPAGQEELKRRGFTSPLEPRGSVERTAGSTVRFIKIPFPASVKRKTISALGPDNKSHNYNGVPVSALLGRTEGKTTVVFFAADEYRVSLPIAKVVAGVLVESSRGTLQLVAPGLPPHDWVDWIVRVDLR